MNVTPPIAKKVEKRLEINNDVRIDNYYWINLRVKTRVNKKTSKEIIQRNEEYDKRR